MFITFLYSEIPCHGMILLHLIPLARYNESIFSPYDNHLGLKMMIIQSAENQVHNAKYECEHDPDDACDKFILTSSSFISFCYSNAADRLISAHFPSLQAEALPVLSINSRARLFASISSIITLGICSILSLAGLPGDLCNYSRRGIIFSLTK